MAKTKKPPKPSTRLPAIPRTRDHGDAKKYDRKKLKEVEAKVRELANEGKVEFASQDKIDKYPELVNRFLFEVLSIKAAFVTDESFLSDFLDSHRDLPLIFARTEKVFGVNIHENKVYAKPLHEIIDFIARETST